MHSKKELFDKGECVTCLKKEMYEVMGGWLRGGGDCLKPGWENISDDCPVMLELSGGMFFVTVLGTMQ